MRCRIACDSVSAPSAVCTTDTPSCALRTATLRPPTWARRPSEIARPAASSAARLIRKPLDSFSNDLLICPSVTDRLRYEFCAAMFWLMRRPMTTSSVSDVPSRPLRGPDTYLLRQARARLERLGVRHPDGAARGRNAQKGGSTAFRRPGSLDG